MPPKETWHILSNIRADDRIADCQVCGPDVRVAYKRPRASHGEHGFMCMERRKVMRGLRYGITYKYKKSHCERCGLVPEDPCVLEIDHIKGRGIPKPDHPSNLQTLCANCHKLKTWRPDLFAKSPSLLEEVS